MEDFLNMGGYGGFIWTAYSVSAFVLIILGWSIWRRGKSLGEKLTREAPPGGDKS